MGADATEIMHEKHLLYNEPILVIEAKKHGHETPEGNRQIRAYMPAGAYPYGLLITPRLFRLYTADDNFNIVQGVDRNGLRDNIEEIIQEVANM